MTQRLAPSQVAPMPTVPQLRARPILRRIKDALEAMLSGKARNLTQAAKAAGISREYLTAFNRRKMEDQRRDAAEKEAVSRRATDVQVLEAAERLIVASERAPGQAMPMIFSRRSAPQLPRAIGFCGCAVRVSAH